MIRVECPDCSKSYDVAEELAGKAAKCRECGGRIPIPQLRTASDTPAERTKPAQAKPTSSKSPSPKTSDALPAKLKPTVKPKPSPKKSEEDFFEDDVEEFDDVEEVEEDDFEPVAKNRTSKRKRKNKKAGSAIGAFGKQFLSLLGRAATNTPPLILALLVCAVVGIVGVFQPAVAGVSMIASVVVGGLTMAIASLRMVVVTWRISTGWAIFFLFGGLIDMGLTAVGLGFVGALVSLFGCFVSIRLLIENWDEYRAPVHLGLAGFVFIFAGPMATFLGMVGGGVAQQQGVNPALNGPVVQQKNVEASKQASPQQNMAIPLAGGQNANDQFSIANVAVPEFENLSALRRMPRNVMYGQAATKPGTQPGSQMQFAYYEPAGGHPPGSLPCVIVANGGTILMSGIDVPGPQRDPESAQYIEAGIAVLGISLDGKMPTNPMSTLEQLRTSFSQFRDAQAGLVNVRNGVEFLIQKVPQVDRNQIFIAGQSSAGTLALLAAAYEPRLKGCAAYCPASDAEAFMKRVLSDPRVEAAYPGVTRFAKQVSPTTHVGRISCPVFLFHASDDPMINVSDSRRFEQLLKSQGKKITYVEVPRGGHEDAVIQQGIPRAIPWLKQLAGMSGADGASPGGVASTNPPNSAVGNRAGSPASSNVTPPNAGVPAGVVQPSGRAVTFRFSSFSVNGDPAAAARQALRNVSWADLNDIVIDQATSEIRIGQLGGFANSEPARQALLGAGFQLVGGVSIGAKKLASSTPTEPARSSNTQPAAPVTSTPADNPVTTKTPPSKAASKPATRTVAEPAAPKEKESGPPRQVVTFRYERYTGKGSSANAAVAALKKIKWADPTDIEVDPAKHEIRVGQLEESKEYEPAEKALKNAGFSVTPGVTSGLRKR